MDKKIKEKYIMVIIPVITLIIFISGVTYAFFYAKDSANVNGKTNCYAINYTKGQDISGEINLATSYTGGKSTDIVMNLKPECAKNMKGSLYINTNNTSNVTYSNQALRYTVVVGGSVVSQGFIDGTSKQKIYSFILSNNPTTYKIYIWLDISKIINNANNETYSGFVSADAIITEE